MSVLVGRPKKEVKVEDFDVGPELELQIRGVFMKPEVLIKEEEDPKEE